MIFQPPYQCGRRKGSDPTESLRQTRLARRQLSFAWEALVIVTLPRRMTLWGLAELCRIPRIG